MSSCHSKRTTCETPSFVNSRARKRISRNEEPVDAPEPSIYRARLCKNKFVQDFRNRKVIAGRWVDFSCFCESGLDFKEMFDFQGWSIFVNLKVDVYVYLVKLAYANFLHSMTEHAFSLVNGEQLDLSMSSLNSLATATNIGKKFFDLYGWMEKPKDSKEYNKKTLRLMGFVQNDDGEWVKKGVVTPKKGGSDYEDEEEADTERLPGEIGLLWGSKHPFLLHC
ncbi:hypothetical protein CJ030_MR6G013686 [Morella rubra]|uniref:Uncharacterized protein n=1 Tax=Morella rubra TaxID=262757 RepID=A0A6A1VDF8_9ROSI|nr:hypothetical protein CJ030_MR6G013686 [Morella rubra]